MACFLFLLAGIDLYMFLTAAKGNYMLWTSNECSTYNRYKFA